MRTPDASLRLLVAISCVKLRHPHRSHFHAGVSRRRLTASDEIYIPLLYVCRLKDKRKSNELNNLFECGSMETTFGSQDVEPVQALLSCVGGPTESALFLFVKLHLLSLRLLLCHKISHYCLQPRGSREPDHRALQIIEHLHLRRG